MRTNIKFSLMIAFILIKSIQLQNSTNNTTSICNDYDTIDVCITKPTCCFVELAYYTFQESQCVDVFSRNNFINFCNDIKNTTRRKYFTLENCQCNNYRYQASNIVSISFLLLIILLVGIY